LCKREGYREIENRERERERERVRARARARARAREEEIADHLNHNIQNALVVSCGVEHIGRR
jgi:hypothetical protein